MIWYSNQRLDQTLLLLRSFSHECVLCHEGHQADMTSVSFSLVPFTSLFFLRFLLSIRLNSSFTLFHSRYMDVIENMERLLVFAQFLLLPFSGFLVASDSSPIKGKLLLSDLSMVAHLDQTQKDMYSLATYFQLLDIFWVNWDVLFVCF